LYTTAAAKKHWFVAFNKQVYRPHLGKSWQEDVGMCKEVMACQSLAMLPNFGKVGLGINQNKSVKREKEF
jgi:hypothetical protein